jgi:hypothetical protein
MEDAVSLRSRAELCLTMAALVSDPHEIASLRAKAAEIFARAIKLEAQSCLPVPKILKTV